MKRMLQVLVIGLIAVLALAGCGGGGGATATAPPAGSSQSGDALPADPPEDAADAGPIDESCPTQNTKSFAKTKFALHAGLAFGAFHRYLYKPYKAGGFQKGASGRFGAFIKAGVAALFIKHEIRKASEAVKANPTLCKALAAPLGKLGDSIKGAVDKLKGGDASGIDAANASITSMEGTSKKDGVEITENDNPDLTARND